MVQINPTEYAEDRQARQREITLLMLKKKLIILTVFGDFLIGSF